MKNIIAKAMAVVVMSLALVACKEDKNTIDMTDPKYGVNVAEVKEEMYGPVISQPGVAVKPKIARGTMGDGISMIMIASRNPKPQVITVMCEARTKLWGIGHTVDNMNGMGGVGSYDKNEDPTYAQMSIYNFRKGTTEIREQDEFIEPIMSTANGNGDIYGTLKALDKLDRESVIAFAFELPDAEGKAYVHGWSQLYKVGDVVDGLNKLDLSDCAGTRMETEVPEIHYTPVSEMMEAARAMQERSK